MVASLQVRYHMQAIFFDRAQEQEEEEEEEVSFPKLCHA
jgi:hypothetical protein